MKPKVKGISINFGIDENKRPKFLCTSLLFKKIRPRIRNKYGEDVTVKYFGIRLDFMFGIMRRPIPKIYKREFWLRNAKGFGDPNYIRKEQAINPWNSGNHWFVLTIPCPGIFLSACFYTGKNRQPGFYIGMKTYEVDHISLQLMNYATQKYLKDENGNPIYTWGKVDEIGNAYMCISASLRSDLIEDK